MNVDLDANPHDHDLKMAFQEKHQLFVPTDLATSALLHLQTASTEDPKPWTLCEKICPIQSKTAFPKKKQSLLLDNNENRNSSLGNIILKSDFPTNHTQLVSNAMFLSDYGVPADFSPVSILWFPPSSQQKKQTNSPHSLIWVEGK